MENYRIERIKQGWGNWKYLSDTLELQYTFPDNPNPYWFDLEHCTTTPGIIDSIYHIKEKGWCSDKDLRDFLTALDDLMFGILSKIHRINPHDFDFKKHLLKYVNPMIRGEKPTYNPEFKISKELLKKLE
jgi:hypothetical protein